MKPNADPSPSSAIKIAVFGGFVDIASSSALCSPEMICDGSRQGGGPNSTSRGANARMKSLSLISACLILTFNSMFMASYRLVDLLSLNEHGNELLDASQASFG